MLIYFVLGACLASFFNLIAQRQSRTESIILPPSHCDHCGTKLKWFDLIPVLSFLILRGRCRSCGRPYPPILFYSEVLLGSSFALYSLHPIQLANGIILLLFAYITIWDWHTQSFPNWPLFIWVIIIIATRFDQITAFGPLFLCYLLIQLFNRRFPAIGNGDIDVLFLLIAMTSPLFTLWVLFFSCVLAIAYLVSMPQLKLNQRIAFVPFLFCGFIISTALLPFLTRYFTP